jgi:putative transposase
VIAAHEGVYRVAMMCRALRVSRSGYYEHRRRPPRAGSKADAQMVREMWAVHKATRRSYGSPRMTDELRARGFACSRGRVERIMRRHGIKAKPKKQYVVTTQADPGAAVAGNVIDRDFSPAGPNQVWASDITFIRTRSGWLYLAVTIDLFSRRVVGWATSSVIDAELVVKALQQAIDQRAPSAGLIHHSDRGSQYTSDQFQAVLAKNEITCSMSRKANCWDNAVVESFFGSLKTEWLDDLYLNFRRATRDIFEFIEVFYNRARRHSTLGGLTPHAFEQSQHVA